MIPCYHEEKVLPQFIERVTALLKEIGDEYQVEVILVDDGSRDSTWARIREAAAQDGHIRGIKLSRNFGQQAALTCGYEFARGHAVISLDADLQDPPELVVEMLARWREGADVVFTVRATRANESRFKLTTARMFYWLGARLYPREFAPESGDFRLLSRRALDALLGLREQHRYIRGMVRWLGFRTSEVVYDRPGRAAGETKYTVRKMAALAATAFVGSGRALLDVVAWGAMAIALACLCGWAGLLFAWVLGMPGEWFVCGAISLLFPLGVSATILQVAAAAYLGRVFEQVRQRPLYIVEEVFAQEPARVEAPRG